MLGFGNLQIFSRPTISEHRRCYQRVSDFAINEQVRRRSPPNRTRYSGYQEFALGYFPRSLWVNAVAFGYGVVAYSDTDLRRANVTPVWAR